MTLPIERARSRRPITWLTLAGVLLLPAVVGGILVSALQNPTERLDAMTAAVVNLDEPVTIDGQYTPLGRQLAAGLVEGSDDLDSNLTWVVSNEEDAASGLGDGTYQAVVTIPESFSSRATSAGTALQGGDADAEQAEIMVTTPSDGRVADDLITRQIASVAASTMGSMLSEATIGNVLVGFGTIGDQIGTAADGARGLADGARDAATGAAALPEGAAQLATGADGIASGATSLAVGLDTVAAKAGEAGDGAVQLGRGLESGAAALTAPQGEVQLLVGAAGTAAAKAQAAAAGVGASAQSIGALAQECLASGASADFCSRLGDAAASLGDAVAPSMEAAGYATEVSRGIQVLPGELASQMRTAGSAAVQLGGGLDQLATGVARSADGARALSTGASQLGDGAGALAEGTSDLAVGLDALASGTGELAEGLKTASTALPSFDEKQSTSLAAVIADPVTAGGGGGSMFGPTAVPLLAAVVLWFGGLASFVALRAVPGDVLTSRRSSLGLVLRGLWPAAALGAGQGVLVALIVQVVAGYDAAAWWGFAVFAVLAGVAFAAVNQALVAVLGGAGRWIGALVGVIAVATGLISTIPGWLAGLGAAMPTAPALSGLISPSGAAGAALIVWGVLSLAVAVLATSMRRTTSAKAVLAAAP